MSNYNVGVSTSIYDVELTMLDGSTKKFSEFKNQKVLVVNVASRCGLSHQYEQLEKLQKKYADQGFTVLGCPSNQFMQELKDSEKISEYCYRTWGITFPITDKLKVNGRTRHELYQHLTKTKDRSGMAGPVMWNFEKFLVMPGGEEIHRFRPQTKPDSKEIISLIES